jgi:hypothetical protein
VNLLRFPFWQKPKPKEEGPRYADMYVRAVAAGIDMGLLFFILNDLFSVITAKVYAHVDRVKFSAALNSESASEIMRLIAESGAMHAMIVNSGAQLFMIGVIYLAVQWTWGITPGKWVLSIRVRRVGSLEPPSRFQFLIRFLAYIPAALPLMLGILWASFNKQRRGWHDYIAGTVVVHLHPEGWYIDQVKNAIRRFRARRKASE